MPIFSFDLILCYVCCHSELMINDKLRPEKIKKSLRRKFQKTKINHLYKTKATKKLVAETRNFRIAF